ncbi:MAG: response regulator [Myxococcales bacterium]|nr:response regulator [Myxococcales bacterium]
MHALLLVEFGLLGHPHDAAVLDPITQLLLEAGWVVTAPRGTAEELAAAVVPAEGPAPDLIFATPLHLRGLRKSHPSAVIVALDVRDAARAEPHHVALLDAGADDILGWPCSDAALLAERVAVLSGWARRAAAGGVREIEESNARYRLVARATNDVLYDWDIRTGKIVWNNALKTVLGYSGDADSAGIQWWTTQVHPEDSDRVARALDRALQSGAEGWSDSYRFATGKNTWIDLIDRGIFMRDGLGQAQRLIGAMMDVTGRKQLQTKLVLADRLASVGTMAAGVAHELNNPLTWVLANIRLVQEGAGATLPTAATRALANAAQGAERMRSIVRDLKVFSGNKQQAVVPVDVRATLLSALGIVHHSLSARAHLEHVDETSGPLIVLGNEARLAQVLLNLLVNAVQSIARGMPERNRVRVTVARDGGDVIILISDTGCGIPAAARSRVFDPFFTTKPTGEGTGLGLSIGLQLAQEMGGDITLVPLPGRGTTFRVRLRCSDEPLVAAHTAAPDALVRGAPARVLVVDDELMIVELVEQILTPEFEVHGEHQASSALDRLRAGEKFDAVLCDVMMPGMNGMDFYREVAQVSPAQASRFLFVTGGVASEEIEAFLLETGCPFVAKPFDLHALRAKVRGAVKTA